MLQGLYLGGLSLSGNAASIEEMFVALSTSADKLSHDGQRDKGNGIFVDKIIAEVAQLAMKGNCEQYRVFFAALSKLYPEVGECLKIKTIEITDQAYLALNHGGIEIIIDYLKAKKSLLVDIFICDDITEACLEITRLMLKGDEGMEKYMIVYDPVLSHYFPIYCKKEIGHVEVFVTDSLGSQSSSVLSLLRKLKASLKLTIYLLSFKRQTSEVGCSVFAIRDLVELSRNSLGFITQVKASIIGNSPNAPEGLNTYEFHDLPPGMMKLTEENKKINDYMKKHSKEERVVYSKKNVAGVELLEGHIDRHRVGKLNRHLIHRLQKYINYILREILQENEDSVEKNFWLRP